MNIGSRTSSVDRKRITLELLVPWTLFGILLLWGWRVRDLFHAVPGYGDVLEVLWGIGWYNAHLLDGQLLLYPLVFYPGGWQTATYAGGPAVLIPWLVFYRIGGAAFAYNMAVLLSFFLCFAGMYLLARRFSRSLLIVTLASLLFTFWGFRWLRIYGHLDILIASALLPWMIWSLERAICSQRWWAVWASLVGAIWAVMIASSLYFAWFGGLVLVGWIAGRILGKPAIWRPVVAITLVSTVTGFLLSVPAVVFFLEGNAAAGASFYDVLHLNSWGASLNSLAIPFVFHPLLGPLARSVYQGPTNESGVANLGFFSSVIAVAGLWWIRKDRDLWPALILLVVGVVLALGFTLKWNGQTVQWPALQPIDSTVWQVAYLLKPGFFRSAQIPSPLDGAAFLPGAALIALVPFEEGARVLSRFALVAAVGFFLLVARQVDRLPNKVVRAAACALLIIEALPPPSGSVPFPPPSHPAFEWLREQTPTGTVVVDLYAVSPYNLALAIRGETLWATLYHQRATVSGTSSVWPDYTAFLVDWFRGHPHPFRDPEFAPMMRSFGVNDILLHVQGDYERNLLKDWESNPEIHLTNCFDPPSGPSPWPYPICVLQVLPPAHGSVDVQLKEGWSSMESWGVWAEGKESRLQWVAASRGDHHLLVRAFPECFSDEYQKITLEAKGVILAEHDWKDCEPWSADILIPASLVQVGWNEVELSYRYAVAPSVLTRGKNNDMRLLSVGFDTLEVETP